MLLFMMLIACDEKNPTFFYDVSSTVMITDESGMQINAKDAEFCQLFTSVDYDTTTSWEVNSEQCETVDIEDGVAILSNWEGEYFGPDVSINLELRTEGGVYLAELLDNDDEVWCDNQVIKEVDEHNDSVTYSDLCSENYERYLLWTMVLPTELFISVDQE